MYTTLMASICDLVEGIYHSVSIYKSCILCMSEQTVIELCDAFTELDHTVERVLWEDLNTDRPSYAHALQTFKGGGSRMLILTYRVWKELQADMDEYIMDIDLLVMVDLCAQSRRIFFEWSEDAQKRGYWNPRGQTRVLITSSVDEETFSSSVE